MKKQLPGHHHARVLFVNEDGDVLSVYCSVLYSAKVMDNNKVKHRSVSYTHLTLPTKLEV